MSVLLLLCPLVDMFSVVTRLPDVGLGSVSFFFFFFPLIPYYLMGPR